MQRYASKERREKKERKKGTEIERVPLSIYTLKKLGRVLSLGRAFGYVVNMRQTPRHWHLRSLMLNVF